MEEDFHEWYEQAVKMAQPVDVQPSKQRAVRCWSRVCDSAESNDIEEHFHRSVAVPILDSITTQLKSRLANRNQVELFNLLPSRMLREEFDLNTSVSILKSKFSMDMEDGGLHFKHELIRWKRYWEKEMEDREKKTMDVEENGDRKSNRKFYCI